MKTSQCLAMTSLLLQAYSVHTPADVPHTTQVESTPLKPKLGEYSSPSKGVDTFVNMSSVTTLNGAEKRDFIHRHGPVDLRYAGIELAMILDEADYQRALKQGSCYNYVTSTTPETHSIEKTIFSGRAPRLFTCAFMRNEITKDPDMRIVNTDNNCDPSERKIFVFLKVNSNIPDIHFIAEEDGQYSHKQGTMPAGAAPKKVIEDGVLNVQSTAVFLRNEAGQHKFIGGLNSKTYQMCEDAYCYKV